MTQPPDHGRLDHIDGLRTIAILWVALYHYTYFWTPAGKGDNLLPYGDLLAKFPFADVGYLGVYLFFIVSGFVIAMSLTRSASIGQFVMNRGIRLWPTMIICGTITFVLTTAFGPDELRRSPVEYLISLTFIPPPHVGKVIGMGGLEWLDGAYWSLWAEVRFYVIAALLYFLIGRSFLRVWAAFALTSAGLHVMGVAYGGVWDALARLLFTEYQPFFTAGIALATIRFGQDTWSRWVLTFAIAQTVAYPAMTPAGLTDHAAAGLILVYVFALPVMLSRGPIPVLSSRLVTTIGVASYAYYLLHQNAGMAALNLLADQPPLVTISAMILIQLGILAFAVVLTLRVEAPLRRALRRRLSGPKPVLRPA